MKKKRKQRYSDVAEAALSGPSPRPMQSRAGGSPMPGQVAQQKTRMRGNPAVAVLAEERTQVKKPFQSVVTAERPDGSVHTISQRVGDAPEHVVQPGPVSPLGKMWFKGQLVDRPREAQFQPRPSIPQRQLAVGETAPTVADVPLQTAPPALATVRPDQPGAPLAPGVADRRQPL